MFLYLLPLNNNKDANCFAPIFQSTTNYRFSMMLCRSSLTYKPMPINIPLDDFPISMYREFQENGLSLISLSHRGGRTFLSRLTSLKKPETGFTLLLSRIEYDNACA